MKNKKNMRRFLSGFLAMLTVLSTILSPILSYAADVVPVPEETSVRGSENIGKILLLSFKDSEEEMIESVLAALKTGRNIYCDEKNINPLKIHYGDIVILLATRELFRKQKKIDF